MEKIFDTVEILQEVIFPCMTGSYLFSERPALEGIHAFLCAKEIGQLLGNKSLILSREKHLDFKTHKEGKQIITSWAKVNNLEFEEEVDISVGVADVLVYADDVGIFEIGTTKPAKMFLLLKYILRLNGFYTVHFWPYGISDAFVFKNWRFDKK